jgi:hypothetical protein
MLIDVKDNKSFYELNTDYLVLTDEILKDKNIFIMDEESAGLTSMEYDQSLFNRINPQEETARPSQSATNSNDDRVVYEVTAIKYTLPNNEHVNSETSANTYAKDQEFIFKYNSLGEVSNSTLLPLSVSTSTSVKKLIRLTTKKFYRRIPNIEKLIFLNATTGDIYLLEQPDREQILNIRFHVYVRDMAGQVNPKTLNNSVPVQIEIIDINDSRPQCISQRGAIQMRHAASANKRDKSGDSQAYNHMVVSSKPIDIYSLQVNMNKIEQSGGHNANSARLVKLYKFRCKDADSNANAEISYEIEKLYLKDVVKQRVNSEDEAFVQSTDPDVVAANANELSEFLNEFFVLNANTGVLYLNMNAYLDEAFHSRLKSAANKKFVVIRVRVADNGLVALYNIYHLKFVFCFTNEILAVHNAASSGSNAANEMNVLLGNDLKYCRFKGHVSNSEQGKVRPVFVKSLGEYDSYDSADEEASLNDISDESEEHVEKEEQPQDHQAKVEDAAENDTARSSNEQSDNEDIYVDLLSRGASKQKNNFDLNQRLSTDAAVDDLRGGNGFEKTTKKTGSSDSSERLSRPAIDGFLFSSSSSNLNTGFISKLLTFLSVGIIFLRFL